MSHTGIRKAAATSAAVVALLTGAGASEAADTPGIHKARSCSIVPQGVIAYRWNLMGGADGPLGCPVFGEQVPRSIPPGFPAGMGEALRKASRHQLFERGDIVFSPHQGRSMTVAGYAAGDKLHVEWGPTAPFHYGRFLVSIDGRQTERPGGEGQQMNWSRLAKGEYAIVVEGCDGSTCRQGWTVPIHVFVPGLPVAPPTQPKPPPATPPKPNITATSNADGSFTVRGGGFAANTTVHIRAVDDQLTTQWFDQSAGRDGTFTYSTGKICRARGAIHFSANDGRRDQRDLTGTLWSNTSTSTCPG